MAANVHIYKSTDNGATWTEMDTGNAPDDVTLTLDSNGNFKAAASWESGDIIPITYVRSSDDTLVYIPFDASTDTYGASITGGPGDVEDHGVELRNTDGEAIVLFKDSSDDLMYYVKNDGSWGTPVAVGDSVTNLSYVELLQQSTGVMHFLYSSPGSTSLAVWESLYHRSLSTGDVLSSQTQAIQIVVGSQAELFRGCIVGDSILIGGAQLTATVNPITGGTNFVWHTYCIYGTPLSNPTWSKAENTAVGASNAPLDMIMVTDGTNGYGFWVINPSPLNSDQQLLYTQQFGPTSWLGSPSLFYDSFSQPPETPETPTPQVLRNLSIQNATSNWEVLCSLQYKRALGDGGSTFTTGYFMSGAGGGSSTTTTTTSTTSTTTTSTTSTTTTVTFTTSTPDPPEIRYRIFRKDPDATLDYTIDWSKVLDEDETISASSWSASSGDITVESDTTVGQKAIAFLSGGTLFETYIITNQIETSAGRIYNQQFKLTTTRR